MAKKQTVIAALSGGVDSAVAAALLLEAGFDVQGLHMTNWEDDAYCDNAQEFQDARDVCAHLQIPLHRVNFAAEYKESVFTQFLDELRSGRTPNPDVLCNREIKFGHLRRYANRLGGDYLATGHYARLQTNAERTRLLKGIDGNKDQSYFLHAVHSRDLRDVLFPLGDMTKPEVRQFARHAGLSIAEKKDSTGICFIGERPFAEFLNQYLPTQPGPIVTIEGEIIGTHIGLAFYTLGQRQGLDVGGLRDHESAPWYVAAKRSADNSLVVVQGGEHSALLSHSLNTEPAHWFDTNTVKANDTLECTAKTRYRQPDQPCTVEAFSDGRLRVAFTNPQRAVTPGQYVVFYSGDECLGGATIDKVDIMTNSPATHSESL